MLQSLPYCSQYDQTHKGTPPHLLESDIKALVENTNKADQKSPAKSRVRKSRRRRAFHGVSLLVIFLSALLVILYLVLLVRPVPLPFVGQQVRAMVLASMPDFMELELGATSLTLENGVAPALRFSPVVLVDKQTGGKMKMEALEVGFSPFRALLGQPGAIITLVRPQMQVIQDLIGPRLAQFKVINDPAGGQATVKVTEGKSAFPSIDIGAGGLDVRGKIPGNNGLVVRSDNDWLVYNLEAGERGLRSVIQNSDRGLFSRFIVRDATLVMHDSVYGLVRTFSKINLDIDPQAGTKNIRGTISAVVAGRRFEGVIKRNVRPDGSVDLVSEFTNMDFSAFVPFMDDPGSMVAVHGGGSVIARIKFAPGEQINVLGGNFTIDLTGSKLRIGKDRFAVTTSKMKIDWDAKTATFNMLKTRFRAGSSYADMSGVFIFGLDKVYGPTMRMSMVLKNIYLRPNDLPAPKDPIENLQFSGWSAPLYGAMGIEKLVATSGDMKLVTSGRFDMLRAGVGVDLNVAISGASADDLKRLWPYFIGGETRNWFVENVLSGKVITSAMEFKFPVGTLGEPGKEFKIPDGAINVDMLASGVTFKAMDGLDPIKVSGDTRLNVKDGNTKVVFGDASLPTKGGELKFSGAEFIYKSGSGGVRDFKLRGNVDAPVSALVSLAKSQASGFVDTLDFPLDLDALEGRVSTSLSTAIKLNANDNGVRAMSYALDGKISGFASTKPIKTYTIADGQFDFSITDAGYRVDGPAKLNGLSTRISVQGALDAKVAPEIEVAAIFAAKDFKQFGFDVSKFVDGNVRFVGRPLEDGSLKVSVDLEDASLTIADLALSKARGEPGSLTANVDFDGPVVNISGVELSFGSVDLHGKLKYDVDKGLQSADFSRFILNEGDNARLQLSQVKDGYSLKLRGEQLDLKPLMARFFSLEGGGTGGPRATSVNQRLLIDAKLDKALGFYRTTALNLSADMDISGDNLQKVAMQAQFGGTNSVSITTNPVPDGRVMSVAFNDLGTLLRFVGVYPRLVGGAGSLVMKTNKMRNEDVGTFSLRDFSIINEENVVQILGNDPKSRERIAKENRVDFNQGQADFVRRPDRIEITRAVLDGNQMGGTMRGFIYTDAGQYDLTGTYIPLFELNNAFQQIPILGPLLGGRRGEGLIGITFAIRGDLNNPQFLVNPASILAPGVLRSIFEFRSKGQPAATN
ncbi:hypothetical protein MNBD_ALPHA12-1287 [hydrothermal vent metagenome]|uniref:Uncharacterized protein n=1 Tax=hydrothermal vent metagenome TaxID=652676 RepID=A0A3B0TCJ4_9ZZZZ